MTSAVVIQKNGDLITKKVKNFEKIYSLCNYKNNKDFELLHTFKNLNKFNNKSIQLYGKKNGRANSENKYELPTPIDAELYFGNLLLLGMDQDTNEYIDLTSEQWSIIYDDLMGGFEDIGNLIINKHGEIEDDEERSIDSEEFDDEEYTEEGYHKDGFVVDDEELLEEEYVDDSDSDDELSE